MKKSIRNSMVFGVVAASLVFGGASVFAAGDSEQKGELFSLRKGEGKIGFGAMIEVNEFDGEKTVVMVKMHMADFSWAVEQGIISQETAGKITAHMQEASEVMRTKMEEMKEMTPDELKASLGEKKEVRRDMFVELVSSGIITQSEADALKEAMPKPELPEINGELINDGEMGQTVKMFGGMNLGELVEKDIIDQQTADNMEVYMSKKAEEMKADMESRREEIEAEMETRKTEMRVQMDGIRNMTDEERKELFESGKGLQEFRGGRGIVGISVHHFDILSELVEEGIITQTQADAIKEAMPQRKVKSETEFGIYVEVPEPASIK